jgi:hypothetical protein
LGLTSLTAEAVALRSSIVHDTRSWSVPSATIVQNHLTSLTTSIRGSRSQQNFKTMTKKEIIEDLCHKVADIKYDLQVVLDTLYQLDNEDNE